MGWMEWDIVGQTLQAGKIPNYMVVYCWENHQTKWPSFQQTMSDRRIADPLLIFTVFVFNLIVRQIWFYYHVVITKHICYLLFRLLIGYRHTMDCTVLSPPDSLPPEDFITYGMVSPSVRCQWRKQTIIFQSRVWLCIVFRSRVLTTFQIPIPHGSNFKKHSGQSQLSIANLPNQLS